MAGIPYGSAGFGMLQAVWAVHGRHGLADVDTGGPLQWSLGRSCSHVGRAGGVQANCQGCELCSGENAAAPSSILKIACYVDIPVRLADFVHAVARK